MLGDTFRDLVVDWLILIKDIRSCKMGRTEWSHLAQNTEKWRAFISKIMTFGLHKMQGISQSAESQLVCQEGRYIVQVRWCPSHFKQFAHPSC